MQAHLGALKKDGERTQPLRPLYHGSHYVANKMQQASTLAPPIPPPPPFCFSSPLSIPFAEHGAGQRCRIFAILNRKPSPPIPFAEHGAGQGYRNVEPRVGWPAARPDPDRQ